jgi:hypothetical protein
MAIPRGAACDQGWEGRRGFRRAGADIHLEVCTFGLRMSLVLRCSPTTCKPCFCRTSPAPSLVSDIRESNLPVITCSYMFLGSSSPIALFWSGFLMALSCIGSVWSELSVLHRSTVYVVTEDERILARAIAVRWIEFSNYWEEKYHIGIELNLPDMYIVFISTLWVLFSLVVGCQYVYIQNLQAYISVFSV